MSSITTTIAIAAGIAGGAGAAYAGKKGADAAQHGADVTSQATTHAADLSSQSNAASLAFEQQKDREAQQQFEATQKANYDQWAAKEARMNDIRSQLGMPAHDIPAYSSLTPPAPGGTAPTPGGGTTPPAPPAPGGTGITPPRTTQNLNDPSTWMSLVGNDTALKSWVTTGLGAAAQNNPGLVDYYVGKIKGQPGANPTEQAGSANYWLQKLQSDPNGGGGAAGGPANSLASFLPSSAAGINSSSVRQLPYLNPNGDIYAPTVGSYLPQ